MKYLGDYAEDYATLNFKFSTHTGAGTPITLAGTPAVSVYKANGTTQSVAGVTLSVDFDSVTGLHNVLIDLSSDAFYATANDYAVVITTGTVDGVSVVGTVLAHFSINNRQSSAISDATLKLLGVVAYGTAQSAGATTLVLAAASDFANDELVGSVVLITGGTGIGQSRVITDYVNSTDTATVDTWTTTPSGTITYVILAAPPASATAFPSVNVADVSGGAIAFTKNTALAKFPFVMRDSTNHAPAASLTVTATRSIDGAAFAGGTLSAVSEVGSGVYTVDFGAGDLNGATIVLKCTAAASDTTFISIVTNP